MCGYFSHDMEIPTKLRFPLRLYICLYMFCLQYILYINSDQINVILAQKGMSFKIIVNALSLKIKLKQINIVVTLAEGNVCPL